MFESISKYFDDLENLLYLSVIGFSFILTSDLTSNELLKQPLITTFNNFRMSDFLSIIAVYIFLIFCTVVIYNFVIMMILHLKYKFNLFEDIKTGHDLDIVNNIDKLLKEALEENNSVKYEHFKSRKKLNTIRNYTQYFFSLTLILAVYNVSIENGIIKTIISTPENEIPKLILFSILVSTFAGVIYIYQKE
ncbi:hypothetical protein [Chryseobacterium sp. MYb328]|uniref:hypothetical protein n=1 Tax=Chryseobacterium sp. MYb328 TaxID=2745231 RepID=UPI003099D853